MRSTKVGVRPLNLTLSVTISIIKGRGYLLGAKEKEPQIDLLILVTLDFLEIHVLETPPKKLQSMLFNNISRACMSKNIHATS
jgi:hypothetical protein